MGTDMRNGEETLSFEEYFNRYYSQVLGYVIKKIGNYHNAEDLTMECFAICYRKFDEFDSQKASFGTWLYTIVNNKIKNYYRDNKHFEVINSNLNFSVNFSDDLEEASYIQHLRDILADALEQLNEVQRKIIIYKYYKKMNSNEIAQILGLSSGNVRVQLARTLEKMRRYFENNNIKWE